MSGNLAQGKTIKLVSSDGKEYEVPMNVIRQCRTINKLVEELGLDGEQEEDVIPLQNVSGETFEKVLSFCQHHCNDPVLADDEWEGRRTEISPWDAAFLEIDQLKLYNLTMAAYHLDIKTLVHICCKTIADMIKDASSVEEVRRIYNITNDFTPEEEEQIQREYAWCNF